MDALLLESERQPLTAGVCWADWTQSRKYACEVIKRFSWFLLQNEDGLVEYFEAALKATKKEPRKVIGWVTNDLLGHLKQQDMSVSQR